MKKILVTGGAGFIGSNLIKILLKQDYEVYSLDNYSTGSTNNHIKGANYINDDINNINLINQLKSKIDICFHLAANARVQPSFDESSKYFFKCIWNITNYGVGKKNKVKSYIRRFILKAS